MFTYVGGAAPHARGICGSERPGLLIRLRGSGRVRVEFLNVIC